MTGCLRSICALCASAVILFAQADVLARALQLHQAGDIEGAVREYQAYLAVEPGHVQARSNLGVALARLGRYNEAVEQYRLALRAEPANTAIRLNLALAYYKAAQLSHAATELEAVPAAQPGNLQAALLLADCHLRLGNNRKVIELLDPLEPAHNDDRALAYLLGTALIRDNQIARGQSLIDRLLRDGDSAEARLMIGTAQLMANEIAGALKELGRAVELNPNLPSVHAFHGRALLASGDRPRAIAAFREQFDRDPADFEANLQLGILLKEDQNYEEARRHLERALEVRPGAAAARYQLGALHLATGRIEDARRELEQVVKEAPDFVEAHVSLATVYYRLKRKPDGDRQRAIIEKLNRQRQEAAVRP